MTLKYDNFKFYWSLEITLNVIIAGRIKCCGMEERMVLAYGCRKSKKLICGMEGKMLWLMVVCLPPLTGMSMCFI